MTGKTLKNFIWNKHCPFFLFTVFLFCMGIYYNNISADASGGKVTVYTKNDEIIDCEGKGTLIIGKNIKKISLIKYLESGKMSVTEFKVASGNKYFTAVDGVLFSKDKSELICYPDAKEATSYTVNSYVKSISQNAFAYNKYLESVSIPASVNRIDSYAFQNCEKLDSVVCKATISSIYGMFYNCKSLKSFNIPESVTEIMEDAFAGCESLEIKIGKNVSYIYDNAFHNAVALFEVDKDNTHYTVIDGALYSADGARLMFLPYKKQETYTIPDTVRDINRYAFYENKFIKEIIINAKEFNMNNLYGCSNLEKIIFSDNIENIIAGDREDVAITGYNLKNLKDIVVPETNQYYKSYEGGLYSADYKNMYMIPAGRDTLIINENVESIKDDCNCQNRFKSISISDTNKFFTVKDNVLYDKDMTRIVIFSGQMTTYEIPASVSDISVILNDFCTDLEDEGFTKYNNAAYNLENITVDAASNYFKTVDNVLYNKDMTELVLYPQKRRGAYAVPVSVINLNPASFASASALTELTVPVNSILVLNGCTSLKKLEYSESVTSVTVYGNWLGTGGVQLEKLYLPGSIRYINLVRIGENATIYGYNNTGEYEYDGNPIEDVKTYVTGSGYKYRNLGAAPKTVQNVKAVKNGSNIKVSWKAQPKAAGYKVSYVPDKRNIYKETVLKNMTGGKKTSCTFKKIKLNGKKKILIRAYRVINGIKVYGKPVEIICK